MIDLTNKTAIERANIKATEIAKIKSVPKTRVQFSGADYDIEITEVNAIDGGVEVLARAWDNGVQIGFGRKGDVDLERFLIYNPPILVDDPNGDIIRESTDEITGEVKQRKLKEDPQEALLQTLAHIIKVKKQKFGDEKIVRGKVGNTTSTFFSDPDPETDTFDGRTLRAGDETFATIRGSAGTGTNDSNVSLYVATLNHSATTDQFSALTIGLALFDTSTIDDTDTIDSTTFSAVSDDVIDNADSAFGITGATTTSNTGASTADYADTITNHTTRYASDIDFTNLDGGGVNYNDWAFNATGISNVSKTGITKLGLRISWDIDNTAPTWSSGVSDGVRVIMADTSGTSSDPKLVVEHTSAFTPKIITY